MIVHNSNRFLEYVGNMYILGTDFPQIEYGGEFMGPFLNYVDNFLCFLITFLPPFVLTFLLLNRLILLTLPFEEPPT